MKKSASRRATVRITDLTLRGIIGANRWERQKQQDIIINISIEFDAGKAVARDDLNDTLNYKKIKRDVIALVEKSRFRLLETLTARILDLIMKNRRVLAATVRVDKPHALRFSQSVSVEMHDEQ